MGTRCSFLTLLCLQGLECTFRISRQAVQDSAFTASFSKPGFKKKEQKELTEEQKEKLAAKKEKLRERRREAKLRKKAERESENPDKNTAENGDVKKPAEKKVAPKEEKKDEKVVPKDVKKVEKAVIKEDTKSEKVIA